MKHRLVSVAAAAAFAFPAAAQADLFQMILEGSVNSVDSSGGWPGAPELLSVNPGDAVSIVVTIDSDTPASASDGNTKSYAGAIQSYEIMIGAQDVTSVFESPDFENLRFINNVDENFEASRNTASGIRIETSVRFDDLYASGSASLPDPLGLGFLNEPLIGDFTGISFSDFSDPFDTLFSGINIDVTSSRLELVSVPDGDLSDLPSPGLILNANTQFGDSVLFPQPDISEGSEFNRITHKVQNGILTLGIAGNLQDNFNKLEIFFDSREGGQSKLRGDNPNVNFPGLNRLGDDGSGNGLILGSDDKPFTADYYLSYSLGNQGNGLENFTSFATLETNGGGLGGGIGALEANGALSGPGLVDGTITMDFDNSNIAGVGEWTGGAGSCGDVAAAAAVNTGFEVSISLAELGWDGQDCIKVIAFINGASQDFISNQFIDDAGCYDAPGNLGEPRTASLPDAARGKQYYVIDIPASEPRPMAPVADVTTTGATIPGQPGFGQPDGNVDTDDLGYFINFWLMGAP